MSTYNVSFVIFLSFIKSDLEVYRIQCIICQWCDCVSSIATSNQPTPPTFGNGVLERIINDHRFLLDNKSYMFYTKTQTINL